MKVNRLTWQKLTWWDRGSLADKFFYQKTDENCQKNTITCYSVYSKQTAILSIPSILLSGAELTEYYLVHSGIRIGPKRTQLQAILCILIPRLIVPKEHALNLFFLPQKWCREWYWKTSHQRVFHSSAKTLQWPCKCIHSPECCQFWFAGSLFYILGVIFISHVIFFSDW